MRRLRRAWLSVPALVAIAVLTGQPARAAAEAQDLAPRSCQIADDATATSLMDQWAEAIKTEHPDRITRLFAPDASMEGFASPVTRTTYATIREYYLYYFQFAPQVRFEEQQLELGCNYIISSGNYTWLLRNTASERLTDVPARYRFIFEHTGSQWQIGEHIEELTGPDAEDVAFSVPAPREQSPQIITTPQGPAVAGYLKRIQPAHRAPEPAVRNQRQQEPPSHLGNPKPLAARPRPQPIAATLREQRWQLDVFKMSQ